jgi:hypothetical protein
LRLTLSSIVILFFLPLTFNVLRPQLFLTKPSKASMKC